MELMEAKNYVGILKNRLRHTKSEKQKILIIGDILELEEFINMYYEPFDAGFPVHDYRYLAFENKLLKERTRQVNEILKANDLNKYISANFLDDMLASGYKQKNIYAKPEINLGVFIGLFRDFCGEMGPLVWKKYNELLQNGNILEVHDLKLRGQCMDLISLGKQVLLISCKDLEFFITLAHEIGHAIHYHALNQIGRKTQEVNAFGESLSSLLEWQFLAFLENCGYDMEICKRHFLTNFIFEAVHVQALSYAMDLNMVQFDFKSLSIPDMSLEFIEDIMKSGLERYYYSLYTSTEFLEAIKYFYGRMASFKILGEIGDAQLTVKGMLDFLLASETKTHGENVLSLGLEQTPNALIRELKKLP